MNGGNMPRETRAKVVLVEDHPMFREQLAHLINKQADMVVCAEADNASDGLALIIRQPPSLAILNEAGAVFDSSYFIVGL
jgi:DNA-binding NarL/FixJ family response regulator